MSNYPPHGGSASQKPPTRVQRVTTFLSTHPSRRRGLNWTIWVLAALVTFTAAVGQGGTTKLTVSPATSSAAPSTAAPDSAAPAVAEDTPSPRPLSSVRALTPRPRQVVSHPRRLTGDALTAAGVALPNHARTPGARNLRVTQASIGSTICVVGYTATIRPPSSYTTQLKIRQLATGYTYRGDTNRAHYEEDHLISLELGGSPNSAANLWPQPYASTEGARVKDALENKLHGLVCARRISLATAQHAIDGNWWTSYQHYSTISTAPARTAPRPPAPAPRTRHPSAPPVAPGGGATAMCNDGSYSYAAHHQGACSHHGGVAIFYK